MLPKGMVANKFLDLKLHLRLGAAVGRWKMIGCGTMLASWMLFGILWELDRTPEPFVAKKMYLSREHKEARDVELQRCLDMGSFEEMPINDIPSAVIVEIFMVPKIDSVKLRNVHDIRWSNSFTNKVHFKMEGLKDVKDMIRLRDLMTKWDIKDAFLHAFWSARYRKFAGFRWKGKIWQWVAMIFGHCHAPRWWTRLMRPLVIFLRQCGIRCVIYIDDLICFHGPCPIKAQWESGFVLRTMLWLGLTINIDKSVPTPCHSLPYLGVIIDSTEMTFQITERRTIKLKNMAKDLYHSPNVTPRKIAAILATISSMAYAVLPWRLFSRSIACDLTELKRSVGGKWDARVILTKESYEELTYWINAIQENLKRPIIDPPINFRTRSDASNLGYGGTGPNNLIISKQFPVSTKGKHSTFLEPMGACLVIKEVVETLDLRNGVLEHSTDNSTAVSYLNKQGGRIKKTSQMVQKLWVLCLVERNLEIRAKHVPGKSLTGMEDLLSRVVNKESEWMIPPKIFQMVLKWWNPHRWMVLRTDTIAS